MIGIKNPGRQSGAGGENSSTVSIQPSAAVVNRDTMSFLTNTALSDLSEKEFNILANHIRTANAGIRWIYNPENFQGAYFFERCFLSTIIASARIPRSITPERLLIPIHQRMLNCLFQLQERGIRANGDRLAALLEVSGKDHSIDIQEYVREVTNMIGVRQPAAYFAGELLKLALERTYG
jgi:hypothetical protein